MPEYGFPLTRIFLYEDRIEASVLIRENAGHRKPAFWHILRSYDFSDLQKTTCKYLESS